MRIRRCASRLVLGSAYDFAAAPDPAPRFELPPPPPPPARTSTPTDESHAGGGSFAAEDPSGLLCELSLSPWDLMSQLDLSDPQEKEFFMLTYFVSVPFRASWLLPTNMPASFIKEEEEQEKAVVAVDMVDEVNVRTPNKVARKMARKQILAKEDKNAREPKKKAKLKTEEDNGVAAREPELWMCKKNDGKRWFCHRTVNKPNSYCLYHTDRKRAAPPVLSAASKTSWSSKLRKKKAVVDAYEGFYYYAGFGPSRSKRHFTGSALQEFPHADDQQDQSPPTEQQEKAPAAEDHAAPTPGEKAQTDAADYQAAADIDEPKCDDMGWIAGCDEESSDDAFGFNDEPRVVGVNGNIKRKSPVKKRWRKPVKARSLKSLM